MKQTKSGMSPFNIVFGGTFVEPEEEMVIAAENEVLLQVEGILQAVESLMCMCMQHSISKRVFEHFYLPSKEHP